VEPDTTVEVTYGNAVLNKTRTLVIDTPGVNSLVPMSEDEKVTRDILLTDRAGVVVQVAINITSISKKHVLVDGTYLSENSQNHFKKR
jgi:Fe2+ transport system protein B